MSIDKKTMPPPRCEVCGSEMEQLELGVWQCSRLDLHKPAHMKWFGEVNKYVRSCITFQGKTIEDAKQVCHRCGAEIDLDHQIDVLGGVGLAKMAMNINELGKWRTKWNRLEEKRRQGNLNLYMYKFEKEKLIQEYLRFEREWGGSDSFTSEISITCPQCFSPLGKASVLLTVTEPELETPTLSYEELYALGIPDKILARVSVNLGEPNAEALRRWVSNPHLEEAIQLLKETQEEFKTLQIPDHLALPFENSLQEILNRLPLEIRRRKQAVVDAVTEIAKADAGPM